MSSAQPALGCPTCSVPPPPALESPSPAPLDLVTAEQRVQKRDITWIREARADGWLSEFLDKILSVCHYNDSDFGVRGGVDWTLFEIALK